MVGMARYSAFRFTLDPIPCQAEALARHAGARRFAWNQCLAFVKEALEARALGQDVGLPWSRFALINAFNTWKRSEEAGTDEEGNPGLSWRHEVCNAVFEEAASDLGRALVAFSGSKRQKRKGKPMGFPRFHKKGRSAPSFRMRRNAGPIRVGTGHPRSVTLPRVGTIQVREHTRRLRRLLRLGPEGEPRARILSATVRRGASRWYVSLAVEAPGLHPRMRHDPPPPGVSGGFVGLDRGLAAFVVGARESGPELWRVVPPKPLASALPRLRRASRAHSRSQPGSMRRRRTALRLARHHERVANRRRHLLHEVSSQVVKTHARLVIEDLATASLMGNRRLSRAIADAGWASFASMLAYKADWYGTELVVAPRTYPSTKRCSACGAVREAMTLAPRVFRCEKCGSEADRDLNAARNLAAWARVSSEAASQAVAVKRTETQNARGGAGAVSGGATDPYEAGTTDPAR